MSMKKTIKRKWLTALRSDDYDQTNNFLCETDDEGNDSFCCLGVLADVMGATFSDPMDEVRYYDNKDDEGVTVSGLANEKGGDVEAGDNNKYGLPEYLLRESGLDEMLADNLAQMNDAGASFKKIAKRIERDA